MIKTPFAPPPARRVAFAVLAILAAALAVSAVVGPVRSAAAGTVNPPDPPTWPPQPGPLPPRPIPPRPPAPPVPGASGGERVMTHRVVRPVTLAPGETRKLTLGCGAGRIVSDAVIPVRPFGAGTADLSSLAVSSFHSTGEGSYGAEVTNRATRQLRFSLVGACISNETTAGRSLTVGPLRSVASTVDPGIHTLTLSCPAKTTPVAPGFALTGGPATVLASSPDGPDGRRLTVRTDRPDTGVEFSLRCLGNRTTGEDGSGSDLVFSRVSSPIVIGGGPIRPGGGPIQGRLPACPAGSQPVVAGWEFSGGVVPYQAETGPAIGTIPAWGPPPVPAAGSLTLLCLKSRTEPESARSGPKVLGSRLKGSGLLVRTSAARMARTIVIRSARTIRLPGSRIHRGERIGHRHFRSRSRVSVTRIRLRRPARQGVRLGRLNRIRVTLRTAAGEATRVLSLR